MDGEGKRGREEGRKGGREEGIMAKRIPSLLLGARYTWEKQEQGKDEGTKVGVKKASHWVAQQLVLLDTPYSCQYLHSALPPSLRANVL